VLFDDGAVRVGVVGMFLVPMLLILAVVVVVVLVVVLVMVMVMVVPVAPVVDCWCWCWCHRWRCRNSMISTHDSLMIPDPAHVLRVRPRWST
jgi:hypothetical protein